MSHSWPADCSGGGACRRPDGQRREATEGTGRTSMAARPASGVDSDENELGWPVPASPSPVAALHLWAHEHAHAPVFVPGPDDPFPWSMPERPAGVAPVKGGWRPAATQGGDSAQWAVPLLRGSSSNPAMLEPGRHADGRAACLPLAREVRLRAAGENNASNFVVSPVSIHAALALVAAGARGETQRELLAFLGAGSLAELHRAGTTKLIGRLCDLPQTSFACGVWVGGHTSMLRQEFMDVAASRYAAVAESADFVRESEQVRQRVNAFVSDATNGLIRDVLPPGSVKPSTRVVLANALYFKGTWTRPFESWRTFTAPFHLPDGATVPSPFMTTSMFEQQIAVFTGFKALKLPYKNEGSTQAAFYMLVLLPDGQALTVSGLYDKVISTPGFIRKHTPVDEVSVGMFMVPKFKFTFEFEASDAMMKLGVTRAFHGGDFSGMVAGGDGLFISGVYHNATIEVDEQGTVAAAATAVCIQQCARAPRPPVDFVADRPFLFAIVEERTGTVMFIGHLVNPLVE